MDNQQVELSDIQRFYKNSTVFLTGSTGFIGKLFLEKILRGLPVKHVYILIREKDNVSAAERFKKLFESPVFDLLKRTSPDSLKKVTLMRGDCLLPNLGLSLEDRTAFVEDVNVVFHCAALVRTEEHIKKATLVNVKATIDLIELAKQIPKLKVFIHLGNGFSNCNRTEIKEEVYPANILAENLISACESLSDDVLSKTTPALIAGFPNTSIFTQQVAEEYINRKANHVPICIARPTIAVSTEAEPVAAFVDTFYNLPGIVLANVLGMIRISYYKNTNLDIVPADFIVNECIAAGWQTADSFKPSRLDVPVYNISSTQDNPISQDDIYNLCDNYSKESPSSKLHAYPLHFRTTCKPNYLLVRYIFHTLLAQIVDFALKTTGKRCCCAKGVERFHKLQEDHEYLSTVQYFHHVDNTHKLLKKMSFQDRELFNFDITTIKWDNYFRQYYKGLRFYLLNDTMETLAVARQRYSSLKRIFIFIALIGVVVSYVLGKYIIFRVLPCILQLVLNVIRNTVC